LLPTASLVEAAASAVKAGVSQAKVEDKKSEGAKASPSPNTRAPSQQQSLLLQGAMIGTFYVLARFFNK
jgi:hypothetical protein